MAWVEVVMAISFRMRDFVLQEELVALPHWNGLLVMEDWMAPLSEWELRY